MKSLDRWSFAAGLLSGVIVTIGAVVVVPLVIRGPEEFGVLTSRLPVNFDVADRSSCAIAGDGAGGLLEGTPVRVRRHGPVTSLSVEFILAEESVPVRAASAAEIGQGFDHLTRCIGEQKDGGTPSQ